MLLVPNQAIVIVGHPQMSRSIQLPIDLSSAASLPTTHHFPQRLPFSELEQHMDMGRHDAPFDQPIRFQMALKQLGLHHFRKVRLTQYRLTMSIIFISGDSPMKFQLPGGFIQFIAKFQSPPVDDICRN